MSAHNKFEKGQVLLSLLVGIALFAILGHALFTLVSASYRLINYSSARIAARHLAQEKIELIRNLPFNEIGTVGGIPQGPIEQIETIFRNDLPYTVRTSVVYIDDPFDALAPDDLLPTDYKRVRVDVSWGGISPSKSSPVTIITDISPRGLETASGGGTLSILVFDANAQPVPQAEVSIVATDVTPQVNLTLFTGDNGRVLLPGAPTCINCYQISVTKDGFSTDRTYSTSEVANPDKPHQSVLIGQLTEISFAIDRTGELTVNSLLDQSGNYTSLGNIAFVLRGEKTIGTDTTDELVYKYNAAHSTNASGQIILPLEWDNYTIFVNGVATGYDISGANPFYPISLFPGENVNHEMALSTHTQNSLFVTFVDPNNTPVASVSARLYDDFGFEATSSSGISDNPNFGQVFFDGLGSALYHLEATVSGFINFSGNINISGYTDEHVILQNE